MVLSVAVNVDVDVASHDFDLWRLRSEHNSPADAAVIVVLRLFEASALPLKFGCSNETLLNFVLKCRRLYRKVPYHNFFHVVDVCQTMYTFLFEGKVREMLTDLEVFVLLLTALVHDLDHMGLNNSFYLKTDSPLGILSSASGNTSVLEVHHCNLAIEILSDASCNVFANLDERDMNQAFRCMIDCILATDMARHGELLSNFIAMCDRGYGASDERQRRLVMMMVMKAADISNVTKPFEISRQWAMAVTEEFYQQGDMEKKKGVAVQPMFDRAANNELAKGQIGFIDFVATHFFQTMCRLAKDMQWTSESIQSNKLMWQKVLEPT
jgi:cAMP-specific phosphodiesterase